MSKLDWSRSTARLVHNEGTTMSTSKANGVERLRLITDSRKTSICATDATAISVEADR